MSQQAFPGSPELTAEAPARGAGPGALSTWTVEVLKGTREPYAHPLWGKWDPQALQEEGWVRLGRVLR